MDADELEAKISWQQQAEEEAQKKVKAQKEKEDMHKEERKNNKSKFLPTPDCSVPQRAPVIATQSATQHMDKSKHVPLWYYTNKGLENALATYTYTNNDALTMLCHTDRSTSLIPASFTKESKGVTKDHDIEWEDFCIATPWMIKAMRRAN